MPPEPLLAAVDGPEAAMGSAAPSTAAAATQRTTKQRKRDFRRDRRRRRRITERLASDPTLTDCTKVVALAALAYSDDSAKPVYPAMEAIAIAASCHRRSARRCMVDLIDAGYIRRIQRPIAARRNATNLYYFCEPTGLPAPYREGQRRVSRKRTGRIPTEAQNPSSPRRTAQPPEPAKQVPNRPETEPSDSTHSASTSENSSTRPATPGSASSGPLQTPEPTTETNRDLAQTHLRAAREALRDPNDPRNRPRRTLTT
ncbi:MAG: hypothetical protein ACRD1K_14315 [Acidimicrobiales bacterium]